MYMLLVGVLLLPFTPLLLLLLLLLLLPAGALQQHRPGAAQPIRTRRRGERV
jgi:hypothetical protein